MGRGRYRYARLSGSLPAAVASQLLQGMGLERVRETFSLDRLVADVDTLYKRLLPKGHRSDYPLAHLLAPSTADEADTSEPMSGRRSYTAASVEFVDK